MKIAIDARGALWFRGTGIGTYTYQLVKGLVRGFGDEYLLFCPEVSAPIAANDSANARWVPVPESPDWYLEQAYMVQTMVAEKVALYHMPQNGLNLPRKIPLPVVVTLHDVIPYILPQSCTPAFRRRFVTQMPYIAEQAERLITVSHFSKRDILKHLNVPSEKVVVVYPAPEPIYVHLPQGPCRCFLEQCYGIKGGPLILYLGGFSLRKNVSVLLKAFAAGLKELGSQAVLVLAGKLTPEVRMLQELACHLKIQDRVIYPGYVPVEHLPQFYGAADVFVYPSLYEGFGMPPLEAMACGIPTITSNAAALTEIVGGGAWQVDPYDPIALSQAIIAVVSEDETAARLREKGKRWVKRYSWAKAVMETTMVYHELLNA